MNQLAALALILFASAFAYSVELDSKLPEYEKPKEELKGKLNAAGSDQLNNIMVLCAEEFQKYHPETRLSTEGRGCYTAPSGLISGALQIGTWHRPFNEKEVAAYKDKFGYEPTCIRVCVDALAVFVHKDNPIKGLTLTQVDAIFSSTRKRGAADDLGSWGQLGLKDEWAQQSFKLFGRNSASGTYAYFRERALAKGDFKEAVQEQVGSAMVVKNVSEHKQALGYTGIGYLTLGVRAVSLAEQEGEAFVEASYENALSGKYPLSRYLYIYFNKTPDKPLTPELKAFLHFILSKQGQEQAVRDGYFPLTAALADEERKKLE